MTGVDAIFGNVSNVLMPCGVNCTSCGAIRESRHCDYCGHNEPEPIRPSVPAVAAAGDSINDSYHQKSSFSDITPACSRCGADVSLIDGVIACSICSAGRKPASDGASLVAPGRAVKPTKLPESRCFKTDDCVGVVRQLVNGFDADGKMTAAKLTCPVCGSIDEVGPEAALPEPKNEIVPEPRAKAEPTATTEEAVKVTGGVSGDATKTSKAGRRRGR